MTGREKIVAPVVLAAGDSSRMGYPKALLPIGPHIFLTRILETLDAVCPGEVTVVVGRHAEEIRNRVVNPLIHYLVNSKPQQGQISSIQIALRSLGPECSGCLLWPVDQPAVSAALVGTLLDRFRESDAWIVIPSCGGKRGHPALFSRPLFDELLNWPEGMSPKELIRSHSERTILISTEETAVLDDIDTPEDYYRLTGQILHR
jgi:molybdenum cofactor cytidylyltransferase